MNTCFLASLVWDLSVALVCLAKSLCWLKSRPTYKHLSSAKSILYTLLSCSGLYRDQHYFFTFMLLFYSLCFNADFIPIIDGPWVYVQANDPLNIYYLMFGNCLRKSAVSNTFDLLGQLHWFTAPSSVGTKEQEYSQTHIYLFFSVFFVCPLWGFNFFQISDFKSKSLIYSPHSFLKYSFMTCVRWKTYDLMESMRQS